MQGWKGSRWTFPRGKVDEQESDETCAIREVSEEIGFDVSSRICREVRLFIMNPPSDLAPCSIVKLFIEKRLGKQCVKLFIICGVPEDTVLGPQKRKEISEIRWVPVRSLLEAFKSHKSKGTTAARGGRGNGSGSTKSVENKQSDTFGLSGKVKFT